MPQRARQGGEPICRWQSRGGGRRSHWPRCRRRRSPAGVPRAVAAGV